MASVTCGLTTEDRWTSLVIYYSQPYTLLLSTGLYFFDFSLRRSARTITREISEAGFENRPHHWWHVRSVLCHIDNDVLVPSDWRRCRAFSPSSWFKPLFPLPAASAAAEQRVTSGRRQLLPVKEAGRIRHSRSSRMMMMMMMMVLSLKSASLSVAYLMEVDTYATPLNSTQVQRKYAPRSLYKSRSLKKQSILFLNK